MVKTTMMEKTMMERVRLESLNPLESLEMQVNVLAVSRRGTRLLAEKRLRLENGLGSLYLDHLELTDLRSGAVAEPWLLIVGWLQRLIVSRPRRVQMSIQPQLSLVNTPLTRTTMFLMMMTTTKSGKIWSWRR